MDSGTEVLETFSDKESAGEYRDENARNLREKGLTRRYGVSVRYRPGGGPARPWWVVLRDYHKTP